MNLKNKKVLITGATGGIGNSLVEKFKLDEHEKIEDFINKTDKIFEGIDILVNNAGITLDNFNDIKVGDILECYEMVEVRNA